MSETKMNINLDSPPAPVYRRKEQKIEYEYRDRDR
jgi:hypothetical protein